MSVTTTAAAAPRTTTNHPQRNQEQQDAQPAPVKRKRKPYRPGPMIDPIPRHGAVDGEPVVFVPLSGKRGAGQDMILDADGWPHVERTWGGSWVIAGGGKGYVCSGRNQAARFADQPHDGPPLAALARLLTNADRAQVVIPKNGNALDLRRRNLLMVSREEAQRLRHVPRPLA